MIQAGADATRMPIISPNADFAPRLEGNPMKSITRPINVFWLLGMCCFWLGTAGTAPASAQSESDLRRQNEQLTSQVQELMAERDATQREIETLKEKIAQLEQQLAASRRSGGRPQTPPAQTQPEPEKVTVDESVPTATPRALLKAMQDSYAEATKDMDMGNAGDGRRRAFMKKLESWRAATDRQLRGPITWHVRVIDARPQDVNNDRSPERIVTLVAVDPETDVKLGAPFDVELSRTLTDRLANYEARDPNGDIGVLVLRGTVTPHIRINEERAERGSFDNPPFIGPYAEFLYRVDVKSLMPVADDDQEKTPATQPSAPERRGNKPPRDSR
jgi:cell division protein FtsB